MSYRLLTTTIRSGVYANITTALWKSKRLNVIFRISILKRFWVYRRTLQVHWHQEILLKETEKISYTRSYCLNSKDSLLLIFIMNILSLPSVFFFCVREYEPDYEHRGINSASVRFHTTAKLDGFFFCSSLSLMFTTSALEQL